jgi:hypothetical protein
VRLRIVQDHDAFAQPWFRLELHLPATDGWSILTSGQDREKIKARFDRMVETNVTENQITVLEEKET